MIDNKIIPFLPLFSNTGGFSSFFAAESRPFFVFQARQRSARCRDVLCPGTGLCRFPNAAFVLPDRPICGKVALNLFIKESECMLTAFESVIAADREVYAD
ncbi:MAG: hypothetical protein HFK04_04575 [Oscillospiraceae bacterium]|nr:hypothetical protein [Oscillospiraceae bacterium]